MVRKSSLCLFLVLLVGPLATARIEVINISVEGEGATYEDAINSALAMAVAQVHGIELEVTNEVRTSTREILADRLASEEFASEASQRIRASTKGLVSRYEVSQRSSYEGRHWVELQVELPRLQNSPSSQRIRAAISGIQFDERAIQPVWARLLEDRMSMFLTQTRRFAVLDRASATAIGRERERIRSANADPQERARLGRELGADLLVTGHLESFKIREERFTFQSGRELRRYHPEATFSLRVIDLATAEVRFARQIETHLEPSVAPDDQWALHLANSLAQNAVRSVLDAVFPVTVVHVETGLVYLNTGGDILSVGDLLDVYALEGQLLDPYTGERLGPVERRIGQIRVKSISDKISVGEIVEEVDSIGPRTICRPSTVSLAKPGRSEPSVSPQPAKSHFADDNW